MEGTPLLPLPEGMRISQIQSTENGLVIAIDATHPTSCCPLCSETSSSIQSHYGRVLRDAPCAGRRVQLALCVRKFYCRNNRKKQVRISIRACFSLTVEEIAERISRTRKTVILSKRRLFHVGKNERCTSSISFLCLHFRVSSSYFVFFPSCPLKARPIPRGPRTYRSCSGWQSRSTP